MTIDELLQHPEIIYSVGRLAVENHLISLRDARISILGRGNGFCVREKDGTPSHVLRLSTEDGITIALTAIAKYLEERQHIKATPPQ